MSTPAVSICVPTYNGRHFLDECLRSIAAQSFENFEVLVVDDGSSDGTLILAQDFAALDQRIRVIANPCNVGLVENWNRCVSLARGKWIKFVFQDDLLAPNCIEQLLHTAEATQRRLVFCMRDFIFAEGTAPETVAYYRSLPTLASVCGEQLNVDSFAAVEHFLKRASGWFNFFGEPTCALVHRDVFESLGSFDPYLIQLCDLEYWIRVASNIGFAWCPLTLASFRVHGGSASQRNALRRAFRSSVLDRLVICHQIAYAPAFASFRRAARRHHGPAHYQRKLAHDSLRAMNHAKASTDEPGMWLDWVAMADQFPHLRSSFWQLPLKARAWAERNVLWRWRRAPRT